MDEHHGQLESLDNTVNDHEHRIESLEQELKQIRSMIQDITEEEYFKVVSDEDTADRSLTMTMSLMSI
jgi:prefoldin subunit 5